MDTPSDNKKPKDSNSSTKFNLLDFLREWLALKRNIVVILGVILVLGMAEGIWAGFAPKYLEMLGASVWIIALYGTLQNFLDSVYQYPGGWLADKLGRKKSIILFVVLATIGYAIYFFSPSWEWFLFGTLFVMAWSSLTLPAIFSIVGDNLPKTSRATGFSVQALIKRLPVVVAPLIGGLLISYLGLLAGFKIGLIIAILLALVSLFVILRYYKEKAPVSDEKSSVIDIWKNMDPKLKKLLVSDVLARLAEGIPAVFIVLYILNILRYDAFAFGWLTSIQMIASILLYIPIAKMADKMDRKPFVLLTFFFFALYPLALVSASSLFLVAAAFVIGGLREIGEPTRKALIVDLAQESARGRVIGVYYLIRGFAVFPASLIGGWLWTINPVFPFYVASILGFTGVIFYALKMR
ncbi:MFS transporter [Candidatus Micrarchaeota archaeon]|nr:MFS transporter [Candidatus Micrarchaeota archaeon]